MKPSLLSLGRDGSTALEFGIVGAAFVGLLLAVTEIGFYGHAQTAMDNAAAAAARNMQTRVARGGALTAVAFNSSNFCRALIGLDCSRVTITLTPVTDYKGYAMSNPPLLGGLPNPASLIYNTGAVNSLMLLRAYYDTGLPSWPLGLTTIVGSAAYQNE